MGRATAVARLGRDRRSGLGCPALNNAARWEFRQTPSEPSTSYEADSIVRSG